MWNKMLASGKTYFTVCKKCFQNGSYCTTQCKIKGHPGSSKEDWSVCEETRAPAGKGWMRMSVLSQRARVDRSLAAQGGMQGYMQKKELTAVCNFSQFSPPVYCICSVKCSAVAVSTYYCKLLSSFTLTHPCWDPRHISFCFQGNSRGKGPGHTHGAHTVIHHNCFSEIKNRFIILSLPFCAATAPHG